MRTIAKLSLAFILYSAFAWAQAPTFTEYPTPTANSAPREITTGPDGALWFTEAGGPGGQIGRIATDGKVTEYPIPTVAGYSDGIAAGPDGALWFTEFNPSANKIGRISTAGIITEYPIPTLNSNPYGITAGPDGALWFTESYGNKIGRITTAGVFAEFALPRPQSNPQRITTGPDGALWFAERGGSRSGAIGRISTTGLITEFGTPTGLLGPIGITSGPDGALWFTEYDGGKIGRITTAGTITEYPAPTSNSQPDDIAAGPDGALWFTESAVNQVGRITVAGDVTEYQAPTPASVPSGITAGPDGALWFTEATASKIARIAVGSPTPGPMISGVTLPQAEVGSPYSGAIRASGGTPPYSWTVGSGSFPLGLTLNSSTGVISGTPTNVGSGTFNFGVTLSDSTGATSAPKNLSMNVAAPLQVVLGSGAVQLMQYANDTVAVGGFPPYSAVVSSGSLPAGLSLALNGNIIGNPTALGTSTFTLQVTDSASFTASAPVRLQVLPAVAITTTALPVAVLGVSYLQTMTATGGLAPYSWSLYSSSLPVVGQFEFLKV